MTVRILSMYFKSICLSEIVPVRNLVLDTAIPEGSK